MRNPMHLWVFRASAGWVTSVCSTPTSWGTARWPSPAVRKKPPWQSNSALTITSTAPKQIPALRYKNSAVRPPSSGTAASVGGRSIVGSLTGTPAENEDNLAFSSAHGVAAMIETMPFEDGPKAYERMMSGAARFRVVLDIAGE